MSAVPARSAGGRGIASRLLLAQGLVLVAGILTAALVAVLVGPPLFHQHLLEAGHAPDSPEIAHIERAYQAANMVSLGVAMALAVTCALAVTWHLTRRLQRPLTLLTRAAREMSRGHYQTRVPVAGAGPELDTLAAAFNAMAIRLETSEQTRRRLLSDLAHELRTPIATIGAYLDGLEDGVTEWGPATARVLRDQADRLARLATDIDEVSRAEEGRIVLQRTTAPAGDLVWAAAQTARAAYMDKGVNLLTDSSAAAGAVVDVDRQRIAQVLGNLLTNALRHTPPGGTVTVSAAAAGDEVTLSVADNGEGIAPEQLPHVFERFYRGDSARSRDARGAGIGLTIAKALVDAHAGAATADSPGPGRGATFVITLPKARSRR